MRTLKTVKGIEKKLRIEESVIAEINVWQVKELDEKGYYLKAIVGKDRFVVAKTLEALY